MPHVTRLCLLVTWLHTFSLLRQDGAWDGLRPVLALSFSIPKLSLMLDAKELIKVIANIYWVFEIRTWWNFMDSRERIE